MKAKIYYGEQMVEWSGRWNLLPPLIKFPMVFHYAYGGIRDDISQQVFVFRSYEENRPRQVNVAIPLYVCLVVEEHEEN